MVRQFCILGAAALTLTILSSQRGPAAERSAGERLAAGDPIRVLVEQLGDDSFERREQASQALSKLGVTARPALMAGSRSADPEVRSRSRRILEVLRRVELQGKLAAFIADNEGSLEHDLPGWKRYRELLGHDQPARELFVAMQRAEGDLLHAAESNPQTAAEQFASRGNELQQSMFGPMQRQIPLGSIAALLFIGSDPAIPLSDQGALPVGNFVNQQAFNQAISAGPQVKLAEKLLGAWIRQRTESMAAYSNLHLAMRYNLKEGLPPALRLVQKGKDPNQLQFAVLAVGKLGTRTDAASVLPALENRAVCSSYQVNNVTISTEVRDVALAVLLHMTGQTHKDYGFERIQTNPQILFNVHTLGFEKEEQRVKALEKWQNWAKEHTLELTPPAPNS